MATAVTGSSDDPKPTTPSCPTSEAVSRPGPATWGVAVVKRSGNTGGGSGSVSRSLMRLKRFGLEATAPVPPGAVRAAASFSGLSSRRSLRNEAGGDRLCPIPSPWPAPVPRCEVPGLSLCLAAAKPWDEVRARLAGLPALIAWSTRVLQQRCCFPCACPCCPSPCPWP